MPRTASGDLVLALASGFYGLTFADLFTFTLADGSTIYRWTSWSSDLAVGGYTFSSRAPFLKRSTWNVVKTMQVPELKVEMIADNAAFNGGANIKTQIHNGLFDGATFLLQILFMPSPGDPSLGTVDLFSGAVGGPTIEGNIVTLPVKGRNNLLDQYAPRNVYQIGCNHAFCDAGCTLNRVSFTASFTVGSSPAPSNIFVPWSSAPGTPGVYLGGTITMTSGNASGQKRTISAVDSTGITVSYPFYTKPSAGDSFSAFQGCDKTFNGINGGGSVQSCTARSNTTNYDGFEFIPPPNAAY